MQRGAFKRGAFVQITDHELARRTDNAAAALCTTRVDIVARALNQYLPTINPPPPQQQLGDYPSLPVGYHLAAMRIYHAMIDLGGGPVTSTAIAEVLGVHRGNVDRHLTRLRSDGYVRRTPVGHVIVLEDEKAADLSDDRGPTG